MMAAGVWGEAQQLLRDAADVIEQRSAGRDEDGKPDTIALAADAENLTEAQVLAGLIGVKRVRLSRGGDYDSAIDLLAYEARRIAHGTVPNTGTAGVIPPSGGCAYNEGNTSAPPSEAEIAAAELRHRSECDDDGEVSEPAKYPPGNVTGECE